MKKVFSSHDPTTLGIVRSLLRGDGIESELLNEHAAATFGGIPFIHAGSEIWVQDQDETQARSILERFESGALRESMALAPWTCSACGEVIEGQFTECWHCVLEEEDRDPREAPDALCSECGYVLRSLPERRCPECGKEF